jgi:hypothetical protein
VYSVVLGTFLTDLQNEHSVVLVFEGLFFLGMLSATTVIGLKAQQAFEPVAIVLSRSLMSLILVLHLLSL